MAPVLDTPTLAMDRAPSAMNMLSLILMTRRLGLYMKASARAAIPPEVILFFGIETSSSDPITWRATIKPCEHGGVDGRIQSYNSSGTNRKQFGESNFWHNPLLHNVNYDSDNKDFEHFLNTVLYTRL